MSDESRGEGTGGVPPERAPWRKPGASPQRRSRRTLGASAQLSLCCRTGLVVVGGLNPAPRLPPSKRLPLCLCVSVVKKKRPSRPPIAVIEPPTSKSGPTIARLDDRVARFDDQIARLDGRVARFDDQIARLDDRVARLDDQIARLDDRAARFPSPRTGLACRERGQGKARGEPCPPGEIGVIRPWPGAWRCVRGRPLRGPRCSGQGGHAASSSRRSP